MKIDITKKIDNLEPDKYATILLDIKSQIETSRNEAFSVLNLILNKRNWFIGKIISEKQKEYSWGSGFIDKLAQDIQNIYPGISGFSRANIFRMKSFFEAYDNCRTAVRQFEELPVFRLSWHNNILILEKLKSTDERIWYAQKALELGWSRTALSAWIKSDLYSREGKAITNFTKTLPSPQSNMAQESFKDPYIFDFLTLHEDHIEQDLEQGLIDHVQKMLLEMGKGFSLVGRQYHIVVDDKDYYIDLLFYHVKLHCFIVVELKAREFDPRDIGQLNFYLSAANDLIKGPEDKPTIGLILCKDKKNYTAEYALRDINKPIGIAEYETIIMKNLPKELKSNLPTIEELENELKKREIIEKKRKN